MITLFFSSAAFYINIEEIRFYPEAYLRIAELYDLFDSTLERKRIMPYSMGVFSAQKKMENFIIELLSPIMVSISVLAVL